MSKNAAGLGPATLEGYDLAQVRRLALELVIAQAQERVGADAGEVARVLAAVDTLAALGSEADDLGPCWPARRLTGEQVGTLFDGGRRLGRLLRDIHAALLSDPHQGRAELTAYYGPRLERMDAALAALARAVTGA